MSSVLSKFSANLADAACFGPQFLLRHVQRYFFRNIPVGIPGVGPIHLRRGESDIFTVRQVFRDRQYEVSRKGPLGARIFTRYEEILHLGRVPVIVDAGANIGAAALWFSREFPCANVVAVEPEPRNVAALRRNVGNKSRIHVLHAAIGATPGFVSVHTRDLGWGATTIRDETGIPVITMADAVRKISGGGAVYSQS